MQPSKREHHAEEDIRQSPPMETPSADGDIEVVPQFRTKEIELEAFMNEVLTVRIAEAPDENAAPVAEIGVNGRRIFIPRGVETDFGHDGTGRRVPITRMFIERLARAKKVSISQNLDPRLGEGVNQLHRKRSLDYPFAVIGDSDKGRNWLKAILLEP